jgi:hypothetical protein
MRLKKLYQIKDNFFLQGRIIAFVDSNQECAILDKAFTFVVHFV